MGNRKINPNGLYGQAYALAQELGLSHKTVYARMLRGWSVDDLRQGKKTRAVKMINRVQQVADLTGVTTREVYSKLRKGDNLDAIVERHRATLKRPDMIKVIKTLPPKARLFCGVAA